MNFNIGIKLVVLLSLVLSITFLVPYNLGYANDNGAEGVSMTRGDCAESLSPDINVKDSLILSLISLCLPGVLENLLEYEEIMCEEVVCKYEALSHGLDPSHCSAQKSYKLCNYVMGEVFNNIPWVNFYEQATDAIAAYWAQPEAIIPAANRQYYENHVAECSGSCDSPMITISSTLLAVTNVAAIADRISYMSEHGFDFDPDERFCDHLDDIQDEIDDILDSSYDD